MQANIKQVFAINSTSDLYQLSLVITDGKPLTYLLDFDPSTLKANLTLMDLQIFTHMLERILEHTLKRHHFNQR